MNSQIAVHTHGITPSPNNAGDFSADAVKALILARKIDAIIL
jgi:hypothetical protein